MREKKFKPKMLTKIKWNKQVDVAEKEIRKASKIFKKGRKKSTHIRISMKWYQRIKNEAKAKGMKMIEVLAEKLSDSNWI